MFSLLNQQQRQQGSGSSNEHKQLSHDDDHSHLPTNNRLTKRKAHNTNSSSTILTSSSSSSHASLPSASSYIAEHPQRVARINFHRLLTRLEKQMQTAATAVGEQKEAVNSVREQTLLRKVSHTSTHSLSPVCCCEAAVCTSHYQTSHAQSIAYLPRVCCQSLESLRLQLESIQGDLDKPTLTDYVHRVTQLWKSPHVDPQHIAQAQLQRMHAAANISTNTAPRTPPLLPILSSSSLYPTNTARPVQRTAPAATSAHPLADASHFTAQYSRPARPATAQVRSHLFSRSRPTAADAAASTTPASHPGDLTADQERGLDALSELAPQLKAQVSAIAAHLKVDEAVVADTSGMLEANVVSVKRENVRLKAWARASCGETCQLSGMIVMVLVMFAVMLMIMKIFPAPRS